MSIMDGARQLHGHGENAANELNGLISQITTQLEDARGPLQHFSDTAANSANVAAGLLGDGHMGTDAVTGAAAAVVERTEGVQGLLNALILELGNLREPVGTLRFVIENVATDLMGRG